MCLHIDLNAGELKEMCTNKKKTSKGNSISNPVFRRYILWVDK